MSGWPSLILLIFDGRIATDTPRFRVVTSSGILKVATPWINYHYALLPTVSREVDTRRRLIPDCEGLLIE